mgnify:CR=1 FL=1
MPEVDGVARELDHSEDFNPDAVHVDCTHNRTTGETHRAAPRHGPLFTKYSLRVLAEPGRFSSTRARRELGYAPRPLQDTIRDTLDWVTTHPAE